jgi:pseudaminic acid synthase
MNFKNIKKPFFIAEISANHGGSLARAKKLIYDAKKYGADAVKFQTYSPESMTLDNKNKDFKIKTGLWKGYTLWDLYFKAQTPFEWHKDLFNYAKKIGIICFSTPFDTAGLDLLESLDCPFYKVASFELIHTPLIKRIAKTKKPIIMSTGVATMNEIELAYNVAKTNGAKEVILLYCVTNYPSKLEDFNLNNIKILKKKFKCTVGFSDHSTDNCVAMASVVAGAEVIEKHIALPGDKKGFDIAFSLKGNEIKKYIKDLNKSFLLMGKKYFFISKSEYKNRLSRRSIYTCKNIQRGEKFSDKNIKIIRPGYGIAPVYFDKIINKKSPYQIKSNLPLKKNLLKKLRLI